MIYLKMTKSFLLLITAIGLVSLQSCYDDAEDLEAGFEFSVDFTEVGFNNTSTGYDEVKWSFGDGGTSTEINPVHSYNGKGTYSVLLQVWKKDERAEFQDVITITETGITDLKIVPWGSLMWQHARITMENVPFGGVKNDIYYELAYDADFKEPVTALFGYPIFFDVYPFEGSLKLPDGPKGEFTNLKPGTKHYCRGILEYQNGHGAPARKYFTPTFEFTTNDYITAQLEITSPESSFQAVYSTAATGEIPKGQLEEYIFALDPDFKEVITPLNYYPETDRLMQALDYNLYMKYRLTYLDYPEHVSEATATIYTPHRAVAYTGSSRAMDVSYSRNGTRLIVTLKNRINGDYVVFNLLHSFNGKYLLVGESNDSETNHATYYSERYNETMMMDETTDCYIQFQKIGGMTLFASHRPENNDFLFFKSRTTGAKGTFVGGFRIDE